MRAPSLLWFVAMPYAIDFKKDSLPVRYQNALNRAMYDLDAVELKVLDAAMKQVTDQSKITDRFLVTPHDLAIAGITTNVSRTLSKVVESFFDSDKLVTLPIELLPEEAVREGNVSFPWFDSIQRTRKGILVRFHVLVFPYLQGLKEKFTRYDPDETADLTGKYALRFYKLLSQWKNNCEFIDGVNKTSYGVYRTGVVELKRLFAISDKMAYGNFKQACIERARQQILSSKCTILYFDYIEHKTGRKITDLEFRIYKRDQLAADVTNKLHDQDSLSMNRARALAWKVTALDKKDESAKLALSRIHRGFNEESFINWVGDNLKDGSLYRKTLIDAKNSGDRSSEYNFYIGIVTGILQQHKKELYQKWLAPLGFT